MSNSKKTIFAITLIAVMFLTGIYYADKYYKNYSFAPEGKEQEIFAHQHAACAAYFYLQNRKEIMRSERADKDKKIGASMYELHAQLGLNFSPNKEKFQGEVNVALRQLTNEIIKANHNNDIERLIEDRESNCANLLSTTSDFVAQVKNQRSYKNQKD